MSTTSNLNKDPYRYLIKKIRSTSPVQYRPAKQLRKPHHNVDRNVVEMCAHTTHNTPDAVRTSCTVVTTLRAGLAGGQREIAKFRVGSKKQ